MHLSILIKVLFAAALIASSATAAEPFLETYYPKNRGADELVALASSLIPNAKFATMNNTIVISTDKQESLRAANQLFAQLDKKVSQLVLRIRSVSNAKGSRASKSVGMSGSAGPVKVQGGSVREENSVQVGGVTVGGSEQNVTDRAASEVQTVLIPNSEGSIVFENSKLNYTARSRGNGVELKISSAQNQKINIDTTITVPFKKWLTIANLNGSSQTSQGTYGASKASEHHSEAAIQIRIDKQ